MAVAALPVVLGVVLNAGYQHWLFATERTPRVPLPLAGLLPQHVFPFVRRSVHLTLVALPKSRSSHGSVFSLLGAGSTNGGS